MITFNFKNVNFIDRIIIILFFLLPISIVFSRFVADAIIVLNGILFLYLVFKNKKYEYFQNLFSIIFFSWCFYLILISILSQNVLLSLESSLFYFRFGLFVLLFTHISITYSNFLKYFSIIFSLIIIIIFFDSFIQYFFNFNILGYPYNGIKLSSFFNDEEILGSFISRTFFLPIIAYILLYKKILYENFILFIYIFATFAITIFSGERTALFILTLNLLILAISYKNLLKKNFIYLISFILIISSLIIFDKSISNRIFYNTISEFNFKFTEDNKLDFNIFTSIHTLHYITAFKMFNDKPILGHGPKMFRDLCSTKKYRMGYYINKDDNKVWLNTNCATHPHSTYMQLFSETGIIGTLPIIILFIFCMSVITKKIFSSKFYMSNISYLCIVMIFCNLWPIMPSGNFFNNWISIIYYLPIAVFFYDNNKTKI